MIFWDADTGTNIEASRALDDHHQYVGVSDFDDEMFDHCEVCGFSVGWYILPPEARVDGESHDYLGHATSNPIEVVEAWISERTP